MNDNIILNCHNINKIFFEGDKKVEVLNNLNLQVSSSETTAILGVSGSGKSTLLHIMAGLDIPTNGKIDLCGYELNKLNEAEKAKLRNQKIGFVYQFHHLLAEFSALENVAMPLLINPKISKSEINKKSLEMLDKVGLLNRASHKPAALSGGERQRVAIARALIACPKLVFMDEPTGNLDSISAKKIHLIIHDLAQNSSAAFIIVTHDTEFSQQMHKIWHLENGSLYNKQ